MAKQILSYEKLQKTVAVYLLNIRKELNLSQVGMAEKLKTTPERVCGWESIANGKKSKRPISTESMLNYLLQFNYTLEIKPPTQTVLLNTVGFDYVERIDFYSQKTCLTHSDFNLQFTTSAKDIALINRSGDIMVEISFWEQLIVAAGKRHITISNFNDYSTLNFNDAVSNTIVV
jgi:hypothetical protein